MATDADHPEAQLDATLRPRSDTIDRALTNGVHSTDAGSGPASTAGPLAPELGIADTMAPGQTVTAEADVAAAADSAEADSAAGVPDATADSAARIDQLTDISLSQDLDADKATSTAAASPMAADDAPAAGAQPISAPVSSPLHQSTSLGDPLPASTARIDSDAFFQDENEGDFMLDEDEASPQIAPAAAALPSEEAATLAAQDQEDEEIQQRLRRQREAAAAAAAATDPLRSVSPPAQWRPMSPPPGSAPRSPLPPPGVEPPEFRGLLYYDGIDSVGRPVVVMNARADAMLQPKLRNRAMEYITRRLEPIVYQGPYVLVLIASGHQGDTSSKLPAMWLIRAYRSLSRPYKKNVKHICLVRPSGMLSAMMVVLRPFLSIKAARKLHKVLIYMPAQVDSLLDIDAVTGGDVKAEQLGVRFLREELGVEPGALTPQPPPDLSPQPPPNISPQDAENLDAEVQLGSF